MFSIEWPAIAIILGILIITTPYLATYIYLVFSNRLNFLQGIENVIYKLIGEPKSSTTGQYMLALVTLNLISGGLLMLLMFTQQWLPLNPLNLKAVDFPTAFNILASFNTSTNLQVYFPENTISIFLQLTGLSLQNFIAPASAVCVMLMLARSFISTNGKIGNFWQDFVRCILYILLPLAILLSILLAWQGAPQNFNQPQTAITLENETQTILGGPVASSVAASISGSNGAGFFNSGPAHPYENPTYISNIILLVFILLFPAAQIVAFGLLVKSRKKGYALLTTCTVIGLISVSAGLAAEYFFTPSYYQSIFWEGKEIRNGSTTSIIWTIFSTLTTNGSLNNALDSLNPFTYAIANCNILLDENIFGGIGSGTYALISFAIFTMFIAGIMTGRTPHFLNKKIESTDLIWALIFIITPQTFIIAGSAIKLMFDNNVQQTINDFSTTVYLFASAAENNGSAFTSFSFSPTLKIILGLIMLATRYTLIVCIWQISTSFANKKRTVSNSLRSDNLAFIFLLAAVIILNLILSYLPLISLSSVLEGLLLQQDFLL